MANRSLRELFVEELCALSSAEADLENLLRELAGAAGTPRLRQHFQHQLEHAGVQRDRLALLLRQVQPEAATRPTSAGMSASIAAARQRVEREPAGDVRDAALIAEAQRIGHLEIATYGTLRTWAELLEEYDAERLLQQSLDETSRADEELTRIALSGVNQGAGEAEPRDRLGRWARLRFLPAGDMGSSGIAYTNLGVRGRDETDLGTLEGFIVEGATGRPLYYVIDSGGWFVGRRYVVPIGRGQLDGTARNLHLDLDREGIERYPEFNPASFLAMSDEEVQRYERRMLDTFAPPSERAASYWELYDRLPDYNKPAWLAADPDETTARMAAVNIGGDAGAPAGRGAVGDTRGDAADRLRAPDARGHEVLPTVGRGAGAADAAADTADRERAVAFSTDTPRDDRLSADEDARARDPRRNRVAEGPPSATRDERG